MKNLKLLLIIFPITLISSCSNFRPRIPSPIQLTEKNINSIEGTYEALPIDEIGETDSLYDIAYLINHKNLTIDPRWDSTSKFTFEIKKTKKNHLTITYKRDTIKIGTLECDYRFKKKGYIKLKTTKVKNWGIPMLFGSIQIKRFRAGLNTEKDLIIDRHFQQYGGAMIIIFGNIKSFQRRFIFKRIK